MQYQPVAEHLHIDKVLCTQTEYPIVVFNGQDVLCLLADPAAGTLKAAAKPRIADRFDQIIQCSDLVAFQRIAGKAGDKHDLQLRQRSPQAVGSLHAGKPWHLDVQQCQLQPLGNVFQQLRAAFKKHRLHRLAVFCLPAVKIFL